MLKEICSALLEADVNVKLVGSLRKSIKGSVNFKDLAPGVNKKRIIQKVSSLPTAIINPQSNDAKQQS